MDLASRTLAAVLRRHWWVLLLRGIAAIAFGVLSWIQPGLSLATLVLFFGAYSLVDGVLGVWSAVSGRGDNEYWWALLLRGLLGIVIGVITVVSPGVTTLALLLYIAVWAIASGLLEIITAVRLRKEIEGEFWLGLGGLASIVFGLLLLLQPGAGAVALVWLIATFAVIFGILLVILAFRARSFPES